MEAMYLFGVSSLFFECDSKWSTGGGKGGREERGCDAGSEGLFQLFNFSLFHFLLAVVSATLIAIQNHKRNASVNLSAAMYRGAKGLHVSRGLVLRGFESLQERVEPFGLNPMRRLELNTNTAHPLGNHYHGAK
jgi:hypothetical protein